VDGSCHSKEGFQVSKGDKERGKRDSARGVKVRGLRHIYCKPVYVYIMNV
jgi:hypothetical protein